MTAKIRERRRSFLLSIALVAVNLLLLNWIALGHFSRIDLTRDRLYTLHPATARMLAELDDLVTMRVFLSEKAFRQQTRYAHISRQLRDLLDEFGARSDGKLKIDYLDPTENPELEAEARAAGIQLLELSGSDPSGQSTVIFNAFTGISLSYGGKKDEVIPRALPVETLEFHLDMAISRLTRRETITIGFNSIRSLPEGVPPQIAAQMGSQRDENDIDGNYQAVRDTLSRQFDVEKVKMDQEIPAHIDLLVIHNIAGMDAKAQFYLDQYLMGGGKLVVLAEGTEINQQVGSVTARAELPDDLFAHYGFRIERNMVLDQQCVRSLVSPPVYFVPRLLSEHFDPESALMNGVQPFYVFLASSIQLDPPSGVEGIVLAQTTPAAWAQEGFFNVDQKTIKPPQNLDEYRQFDMVGLLRGEFTSFYANRALPEGIATSNPGPTREDFEKAGYILEDEDEEEAGTEGTEGTEEQGGGSGGDPAPAGGDGKGEEDPGEEDTPGGGLLLTGLPSPQDDPLDPQDQEPGGDVQPAPVGTAAAPFILDRSPETSIVVVGNSRFLTNDYLRYQLPGSLEFFWTLIDRLTVGSDLAEVRNRTAAPPSVRADLSPGEKQAIKFLGMLGMPTLILILGLLMFFVRRNQAAAA